MFTLTFNRRQNAKSSINTLQLSLANKCRLLALQEAVLHNDVLVAPAEPDADQNQQTPTCSM
jgi:hypothetical protein